MNQGLIPRRYAKALYLSAKEHGADANVYKLMQTLAGSFAAEPALAATMANPFVSDADKKALVLTASGASKSDSLIADFVDLLVKNRRIGMIREIAMAYLDIYRKANKIYVVTVTAAAPMSPAEENRLKALVLSHLNGGSMEYSFHVDPDLIGGFTINIDNERLDASVKNDLKQLRLNLVGQTK